MRTIREASEFYGVPKSTIEDRIKGIHTNKPRGQLLLSVAKKMGKGIGTCAEWGFPLMWFKDEKIGKIVQMYLNRKEVHIERFSGNVPYLD